MVMDNYSTVKQLQQQASVEEIEELAPETNKKINLSPYLRTLGRKAWLLGGLTALGAAVGFGTTFLAPNTYTGSFGLLVEPATSDGKLNDPSVLARSGDGGSSGYGNVDYATQLEILRGREMLTKIAEEIKSQLPSTSKVSVESIVNNLRANLVINRLIAGKSRADATKIIQVVYNESNPQLVQLVLDTTAKRFLQYSEEERQTNINAAVKFIDEQIPELRQRVDNSRTQQQELQKKFQLIDPVSRGQELFTQYHTLTNQQIQVRHDLKELQAVSTSLQQQLKLTPDEAITASDFTQDPNRSTLLGKLQDIESQIAVASTQYTKDSPNLQDLEEKRQSLERLIKEKNAKIEQKTLPSQNKNPQVQNYQNDIRLGLIQQLVEITNQIKTLQVRDKQLTSTIASFKTQAEQFPELVRQYNDLGLKLDISSRLLDQLLIQRETLRVEAAKNYIPWELVSKPKLAVDGEGNAIPTPPGRTRKIVLGLLLGMTAGILAALLWEKRQGIFYTANDVKDTLGFPLLNEVPIDDRPKNNYEAHNIETEASESLFENSFDDLYAKLCFSKGSVKSVMVTSPEPQDGQSTVALNLAKTAAGKGKKVLLVDGNLRKPKLHQFLGLNNQKGLANILKEKISANDAIQAVPEWENLYLLSAGATANKTPKLWSSKMESLMEELTDRYDLVIYDPPHFQESTDMSFLGANTDGIILVVGLYKTQQSTSKKAAEQLKSFRLPVLGIVANNPIYDTQEEVNLGLHQKTQSTQAA